MPRLEVDADLHFSVASPTGSSAQGRVTSSGSHLTVLVDDPSQMLALLPKGGGRSAAPARFGGLLAQHGLSATVTGDRGPIVSLGAVPTGRVSRVVTRSAHVQLGRPAAIAPALLGLLGARARSVIRAARRRLRDRSAH